MQNFLKSVLNTVPSAVFTVDMESNITSWNKMAQEITGFLADEVLGNRCGLFALEPCHLGCGLFGNSVEKPIKNRVCTLRHKDGRILTISKNSELLYDDEGVLIGGVECFEDITEKMQYEQRLMESEQRYSAIVDHAPEIVLIHIAGKVVYINRIGIEASGYDSERLLGKSIMAFLPVQSQKKVILAMLAREKGESVEDYEIEFITKSGRTVDLSVKSTYIIYQGQKATLSILVDISERKRYELELAQRERLLTSVSASIHELLGNRNLENAIKTCFELLGPAADVHSIFFFQNTHEQTVDTAKLQVSWYHEKSGINDKRKDYKPMETEMERRFSGVVQLTHIDEMIRHLSIGDMYIGNVETMESEGFKRYCDHYGVKSVMAMPIFVKNHFWGFVGFNDSRLDRVWNRGEYSALHAFSTALGKAIERQRIEQELERSHKEAKVANQLKSEFLANMSHEIRTPMNGVLGFLDLLGSTELDEFQKDYVVSAKSASEILLFLINDILDLSKIESGKFCLERIVIDIRKLMADTMAFFGGMARHKQLELTLNVTDEVPEYIIGDPARIRQILNNIVGNAIKFTLVGRVDVTLTAVKSGNDHVNLNFTVMDTGIGIPEDRIHDIFQPFIQADSSTTRKFGGSGLGLSISKELARLMGGEIYVQSLRGEGSSFTFNLNAEYVAKKKPAPHTCVQLDLMEGMGQSPARRYAQVLIVEDNEMNRKIAGSVLKHHGIPYDEAYDGQEAYEAVCGNRYDIVFMDCQMPRMDGYESTRLIREYEHNEGTRTTIVAMTANAMEGDREKCLAAGMDDYLSKPIDFSRMISLIHAHMK